MTNPTPVLHKGIHCRPVQSLTYYRRVSRSNFQKIILRDLNEGVLCKTSNWAHGSRCRVGRLHRLLLVLGEITRPPSQSGANAPGTSPSSIRTDGRSLPKCRVEMTPPSTMLICCLIRCFRQFALCVLEHRQWEHTWCLSFICMQWRSIALIIH